MDKKELTEAIFESLKLFDNYKFEQEAAFAKKQILLCARETDAPPPKHWESNAQ